MAVGFSGNPFSNQVNNNPVNKREYFRQLNQGKSHEEAQKAADVLQTKL